MIFNDEAAPFFWRTVPSCHDTFVCKTLRRDDLTSLMCEWSRSRRRRRERQKLGCGGSGGGRFRVSVDKWGCRVRAPAPGTSQQLGQHSPKRGGGNRGFSVATPKLGREGGDLYIEESPPLAGIRATPHLKS